MKNFKEFIVYPIIVLILGGLNFAAVKGLRWDYSTVFINLTYERVTFFLVSIAIIGFIVSDITRWLYRREIKKLKTSNQLLTQEKESSEKLKESYKIELENREKEDVELEKLRAISRYRKES
jgi:hypothetical protein